MLSFNKYLNVLKKNKGFTLVEVLTIASIVSVITATVAPLLIGYINTTKATVDNVNAKIIENTISRGLAKGDIVLGESKNEEIKVFIKSEIHILPNCQQSGYEFYVDSTKGTVLAKKQYSLNYDYILSNK